MSHADVDAVHWHVDLIFYTLPSLVIIIDQVTIWPQVKPILLPALQNSTWKKVEMLALNGKARTLSSDSQVTKNKRNFPLAPKVYLHMPAQGSLWKWKWKQTRTAWTLMLHQGCRQHTLRWELHSYWERCQLTFQNIKKGKKSWINFELMKHV